MKSKYIVECCFQNSDHTESTHIFNELDEAYACITACMIHDYINNVKGLYYAIRAEFKKGIYLAAFRANHPNYNISYQDIDGKRDIGGDMLDIDLTKYDYIIATPPCNWWSRANYRRNSSDYALKTKHLLIDILHKLAAQDKPFIVENVKNDLRFKEYGLYDLGLNVYKIGRHTYWTNISFKCEDIVQVTKVKITQIGRSKRQGGEEVHEVIERWLEQIHENNV